jgi:hypothetical protein
MTVFEVVIFASTSHVEHHIEAIKPYIEDPNVTH